LSPAVPWLCLGAIFITYINIGAYWTYIELASLAAAVDPEWIGRILVWASFCSIAGCLFATVISNRFGLAQPLLVSLVVMAWIVGMLSAGINGTNILVSVFTFNFLWIFIDVYQMATVANIDPAGRYTSLMPGAQGLGQIVGPNLAASLLGAGLGYDGVFVMCAAASLTAMTIYGLMYLRLRRLQPALADAS
jgi:MFS family permease